MPQYVAAETISSILAQFNARLTKLETFPAGAVTLIQRFTFAGTTHGPSTAWGDIPESMTASFVLQRPRPILVLASINYSGSGGTSGFIYARAVISHGANQGPANDVHGSPMAATSGAVAVGYGEGTVSTPISYIAPAGTYVCLFQASVNSGSGTTMSVDTTYGGELDIFALSG